MSNLSTLSANRTTGFPSNRLANGPQSVSRSSITDRVLRELSKNQLGVFTVAQARKMGVGHRSIQRREHNGQIVRCHSGVYRWSVVDGGFEQRCVAAALAWPGSAIAGRAAATIHNLPIDRKAEFPELIVTHGSRLRAKEVLVRQTRNMPCTHSWNGVRILSVSSTLFALAGITDSLTLIRCLDDALISRKVAVPRMLSDLYALPAQRFGGRQTLIRELMIRYDGTPQHRSKLEQRIGRWLEDAGLRRAHCGGSNTDNSAEMSVRLHDIFGSLEQSFSAPIRVASLDSNRRLGDEVGSGTSDGAAEVFVSGWRANYRVQTSVGEVEVDFAWSSVKVALEISPFFTHGSQEKQRRDLNRRRALTEAGWRIIEATDEHFCDQVSFLQIIAALREVM